MDIISLSPFRTASMQWQPRPGTWVLTVVCKATFNLAPVQSELAPTQDPVLEADEHWNDDDHRSLHFANELVPTKPRAEVVLVGHAFAPNGQPVGSLSVRLQVGGEDKSLEVHRDRHFTQDGVLKEGQRFTRMPLVYERAAGGPGSWNPVGVRHGARDAYGTAALPNLQPPGMLVSSPSEFIEPTGLGPLAPDWPTRREKLGPHASSFSVQTLSSTPLPEGFSYAFFNTAPPDQWLEALRDNERIILENLHPEHARLSTSLPGVRPRAFVDGRGAAPQMLEMRGDTLIIDTDRGICSVLFRGLIPLASANEVGRVLIAMEQGSQALTYSDVERLAQERGVGSALKGVQLPPHLVSARLSESVQTIVAPTDIPSQPLAMLPFAPAAASPAAEPPRLQKGGGGLPFTSAPRASAEPASMPVGSPAPPANVSPPPLFVAESASRSPVAPAAPTSPWASGGAPRREDLPAVAAAPALAPALSSGAPEGPGVLGMSNNAADKAEWRSPLPEGGVSAPSPAPAVPAARLGARTTDPRDALSLLWFDASSVRRLRKHKPFREVLKEAESKPADPDLDELSGGDLPAEIEDQRDVFEIVAHASSIDAQGVTEALDRSIREDGKVIPALVLCAGELVMPFDEVERLKATVATVTPMSTGDENLKASLQIAKDFLALPNLASAPAVAEGLVKRILEAFGQSKRAVTVDYVESQTERALLEQRHYQRRKVFGGKHLRGLLVMSGSKDPIPMYLPEALAEDLPMYAHFRVRLVAEVRMAEDQYETHPASLRVLALGRVVERTRR